jgi:hypothetical protein
MWTGTKELYSRAVTNTKEFNADGGALNWQDCLKEDEFVVVDGKLVHRFTAAG